MQRLPLEWERPSSRFERTYVARQTVASLLLTQISYIALSVAGLGLVVAVKGKRNCRAHSQVAGAAMERATACNHGGKMHAPHGCAASHACAFISAPSMNFVALISIHVSAFQSLAQESGGAQALVRKYDIEASHRTPPPELEGMAGLTVTRLKVNLKSWRPILHRLDVTVAIT